MKNERPLNRTAKAFSAAYCGFLRANQKIDRMPWLKFLTALDLNEIEGFPMFSKNIKGGYSASM